MKVKVLLLAIVMMGLTVAARAGDYTFEIPQILGHYLGDIPAIPTYELEVDLGMEFAEIRSASLQLSGTHTPGLAGDLNSADTFVLPAEVLAWSNRLAPTRDVIIDEFLPAVGGPFEFNELFRAQGSPGSSPDFSPWLDGVAKFDFSIHPPMMLAIYYLIDMPSVTITSATLVIEGQPNLDEFMLPGDFDGDGEVNGNDLLAWQRNPGVGALGDWQVGYSGSKQTTAVAVPEPGSAILFALASLIACLRPSR